MRNLAWGNGRAGAKEKAASASMRVLFLTFFETGISSGIFASQIRGLLTEIQKQGAGCLATRLMVVLPLFLVHRLHVQFCPLHMQTDVARMRSDLANGFVECRVPYLPFVSRGRTLWQGVPWMLAALGCIMPLLLYYQVKHRYSVIHCRSYLATLAALTLGKLTGGARVLFDARGLYPEEGVVQGKWGKRSLSYKLWKALEKWMFLHADRVICISDEFAGYVSEVQPQAKTEIIPASIDLNSFPLDQKGRERLRNDLDLDHAVVFVYSGGLGSWHDPVLLCRLFKAIAEQIPSAKLLLLSGYSEKSFREIWEGLELDPHQLIHKNCTPQQVPKFLNAADWALVPLKEIPAGDEHVQKIARTMIGLKVSEYLAAGLPLIVNSRIHGVASLMKTRNIGFPFDSDHLDAVGSNILKHSSEMMRQQCRAVAEKYFDISVAAAAYIAVYEQVSAPPAKQSRSICSPLNPSKTKHSLPMCSKVDGRSSIGWTSTPSGSEKFTRSTQ